MVGGLGHEWAACLTQNPPPAHTTTNTTPCRTPPTPATAPANRTPSPARTRTATPPHLRQVVAGSDLPRGVSTRPHPACLLFLHLTQENFNPRPRGSSGAPLKLQVRDGVLQTEGEQPGLASWLPVLPLAPDVHAEAATLTYTHQDGHEMLRLTLTKALKEGDTPPLWFSSEVAAQLGLPFLNFSHVRGGVYTCPQCERRFPAPNPLKLHLAARCDTLAPSMLWARLAARPSPRPAHKPWFAPLLPLPAPLAPRTPCPVLRPAEASPTASPGAGKPASPDSTSCHGSVPGPGPPAEPRSAFRRVGGGPEVSPPRPHTTTLGGTHPPGTSRHALAATVHPLLLPPATSEAPMFLHPRFLLGAFLPAHAAPHSLAAQPLMPAMPLAGSTRPLLGESPAAAGALDPCAEMETLVSNLGRSRGGHLCLYCGKVYSRKYGLKIHIRTHTGYKPLKCRVCLRPFGDPSNLNKHVRLHAQGETPYRCDHCGKVLVRRRDLERHVRSRHPQAAPPQPRPLTDTDTETDDEDEDDVVDVEDEVLRPDGRMQEAASGGVTP
ncbi:PR domain zinc finger protein 13-like [Eriocheir sinensis]|uniref:PR domain zinc finger protein 13-like n=1 Tax=Eriocheir sinensis TaxID=95602 RepID=UPI0021C9AB85|nr:PR domain zinc finger protein 13-like [Eriocheir sinensis]